MNPVLQHFAETFDLHPPLIMETRTVAKANGTQMPDAPIEVKSEEQLMHWLRTNKTPLEHVEAREGRAGATYYYVRHQHITEILNRLFGFDWDFVIERERLEEDQITVLGRLTVRLGKHVITKSQYGSARVERYSSGDKAGTAISMGDEFKKAASDSLKKCASLIGLGLDLSMPIQKSTMIGLHEAGRKVFGDKWDDARQRIIRTFTGKSQSSKELMDAEARIITAALSGDKSSALVKGAANRLRPVARQLLK